MKIFKRKEKWQSQDISMPKYADKAVLAKEMECSTGDIDEKNPFMGSMRDFLDNTLTELDKRFELEDSFPVRPVPIYKAYQDYLEVTGKEDTIESASLFSDIVPDEVVNREIKELGWDKEHTYLGIHLIVSVNEGEENYDWRIGEKGCRIIEAMVKKGGCTQEVYVPGYIMKLNKAISGDEQLKGLSEAHFKDGVHPKLDEFEHIEKRKEENMLNLFIPVYIKYEYPEFPVMLNDIYDYIDDIFLLTADNRMHAFCMDENCEDENERELIKEISKNFKNNEMLLVVCPFAASLDLVVEDAQKLLKSIKKAVKKKGIKMVSA